MENDLKDTEFVITDEEINNIENKIYKIGVLGESYDALQQSRVEY